MAATTREQALAELVTEWVLAPVHGRAAGSNGKSRLRP